MTRRKDKFLMLFYETIDSWWPILSPSETHLLTVLLRRQTAVGPQAGCSSGSLRQLSVESGLSLATVSRAKEGLKRHRLLSTEEGPNQHQPTRFRINKDRLRNPPSGRDCGVPFLQQRENVVPFLQRDSSATAAKHQRNSNSPDELKTKRLACSKTLRGNRRYRGEGSPLDIQDLIEPLKRLREVYPGPSSDRLEQVAAKILRRSDVADVAEARALIDRMIQDAPRYRSHFEAVGKPKELLWFVVDYDPDARLAKSEDERLKDLLAEA